MTDTSIVRRDTVLIAEDDEAVRTMLAHQFERAGFAVLAAESGDVALALARRERPAVLLLDVDLPGVSGYELCYVLREEFGDQIVIVIVSGVRTESYDRVAGLRLGADEYVVKPFDPVELFVRVERLLERVPRHAEVELLTPRELEVLALLVEGYNQKQIADLLVISSKTTGAHIQHILEKLRVHSRAQAVAAAHRYGLVVVP